MAIPTRAATRLRAGSAQLDSSILSPKVSAMPHANNGVAVLSSVDDPPSDGVAEWVEATKELLSRFYPQARWASLVVNLGDALPYTTVVVIPKPSAAASSTR